MVIETLAEIYLFLFSLYHVFTGIISVFFTKFAIRFYQKTYGFHPISINQLLIDAKPWGNLALVVGIIGFMTFFNLNVYFPILFVFCLLLSIRIGYRVYMQDQLYNDMKMKRSENIRMIIIQLMGIFLFMWLGLSKFLS